MKNFSLTGAARAALLVLPLAALGVPAQAQTADAPRFQGPAERILAQADALDLTAEQRARLEQLAARTSEQRERMREMHAELRDLSPEERRERMRELRGGGGERQHREMSAEMRERMRQIHAELKDLSPEERRARMREMRAEHGERGRALRQRGEGRHGAGVRHRGQGMQEVREILTQEQMETLRGLMSGQRGERRGEWRGRSDRGR